LCVIKCQDILMYIKEQQTAIKIINHNYNFLAAAQLDSYSVFYTKLNLS